MRPLPSLALVLASLLLLAAGPASAQLRSSLGEFFNMTTADSVSALVQKSETALEVEFVDMMTTERRAQTEEVGPEAMARLLSLARAEGVPVTLWTPAAAGGQATSGPPADIGAGPREQEPRARPAPRGTPRELRRNRILYLSYQLPLATYVYGGATPYAFDLEEPRYYVAFPLLAAPLAFMGHLAFTRDIAIEESHLMGTSYLSTAAIYAAYALPFAFMDEDSDARFRTAAILSYAAYPLGVWGGFAIGDRNLDSPGRVRTQSNFALSFGALGFFSPFLYFDDFEPNVESIFRLGLGQSVAFAAAGHFMSEYYRAGENIPGGVTTGILTHAALGAGIGAEIAALSDASSVRPWFGAALAGGTLGFMEGLWYYRKRYDSDEQGWLNVLGTTLGTTMGAGILFLTLDDGMSDHALKITVTSCLVGGALVGYIASDLLTSGEEQRPAGAAAGWSNRLAFNPLPVPEPELREKVGAREVRYRYRMPGLSWRF